MNITVSKASAAIVLAMCGLSLYAAPDTAKKASDGEIITIGQGGLLWREPTDLASRDLIYGAGGEKHQPHAPFSFVKEDLEGSSPKFTVADRDGVKWKVKLAQEARSETAASRLVWSVGYFTNEDYYLREIEVKGLPALHRGQKLVEPPGIIQDVRLKREANGWKKIGIWQWTDSAANTREFNGLKVMMALINNWDLKDINNAVYQKGNERIFMVSDLGASFGSSGRSFPRDKAKDNLEEYWRSNFIRKAADDAVDFEVPARPTFVYSIDPKEYLSRVHMEGVGKKIPRQDARWIGQLLSGLSSKQIRDAFRTSGYAPEEVEIFVLVVEKRIRELKEL